MNANLLIMDMISNLNSVYETKIRWMTILELKIW